MEQITLKQFMLDRYYNRDGTTTDAPKGTSIRRCGNCMHWELLPVEEQPPAGWGVKGQCNVIHDPKQTTYEQTSQTSYCQLFENRSCANL